MPVTFNEPLSFLQRVTEYMEYAKLLKLAAEEQTPLGRLQVMKIILKYIYINYLFNMNYFLLCIYICLGFNIYMLYVFLFSMLLRLL